jgi:hypothetical protein
MKELFPRYRHGTYQCSTLNSLAADLFQYPWARFRSQPDTVSWCSKPIEYVVYTMRDRSATSTSTPASTSTSTSAFTSVSLSGSARRIQAGPAPPLSPVAHKHTHTTHTREQGGVRETATGLETVERTAEPVLEQAKQNRTMEAAQEEAREQEEVEEREPAEQEGEEEEDVHALVAMQDVYGESAPTGEHTRPCARERQVQLQGTCTLAHAGTTASAVIPPTATCATTLRIQRTRTSSARANSTTTHPTTGSAHPPTRLATLRSLSPHAHSLPHKRRRQATASLLTGARRRRSSAWLSLQHTSQESSPSREPLRKLASL